MMRFHAVWHESWLLSLASNRHLVPIDSLSFISMFATKHTCPFLILCLMPRLLSLRFIFRHVGQGG